MEELDPKWIRVSSILSLMPTLEDGKWGYPMQRIDQEVLQRKADLGSKVHEMIAADLRREFVIMEGKVEGYFNSYMIWYDIVQPEALHVEKRFYYEPMNLTGCADLVMRTKEDRYHLVDFKCTVQPDHVKWPIQAALYRFLMGVNGTKTDKEVYFVQLHADGSEPTVHTYIITDQIVQTAISLYNMYVYLTKNKR